MQPTGPTTAIIVVKTYIAGATAAINELFELISILLCDRELTNEDKPSRL